MQHCGNCGALLDEEDLRRGSCRVCQRVITPDIDTVPADDQRSYQWEHINEPASQPFGAVVAGDAARPLHVSVHGRIGIDHAGSLDVRTSPRRRGWLFFLGALIVLIVAAMVAVLVISPDAGGKRALQRQITTTAAAGTGAAGRAVSPATAVTALTPTTIGGATVLPQPTQPGSIPGVATATPAVGGSTPTPVPEITATALPTATAAPNNPPVLYLNPTLVSFVLCLGNTATFTIKNTGGSALKWNALSSDYTLQAPTQGTLAAGQPTTITVKGILLGGAVTVNATDLMGHVLTTAPQSFSVICTA